MGKDLVNEDIIKIANRYDLDVYINTENNVEKAKELLDLGVSGIYTDKLSPKDLER
jgi:hypothetical protein